MNYTLFPLFILFICTHIAVAQVEYLPENATIGKCYKQCIQAEKYDTITQQVLVKETEKRIVVEQAVYDTVYQKVLEKEGFVALNVIPAEYTTAEIEVVMEPASMEYNYAPPVFETQEEYVILEPARYEWKKRISDKGCFDNKNIEDCVVWCWEVIPPRLDTLFEQIVKQHAKPVEVFVPAIVKRFTKTMVLKPASLERKVVPPTYRTVPILKLVSPARIIEEEIPAEYQTITTYKKIEGSGFLEWVEIDCEQTGYIEEE